MENFSKEVEWFEKEIAPALKDCRLNCRVFKQGDFGSLDQIEFDSASVGGNVDFWGNGWLGIFIWSYSEQKELLNVLISPNEYGKKSNALDELKRILL